MEPGRKSAWEEKNTGKVFVFATTHLWWKKEGDSELGRVYQPHSDKARALQIAILADKAEQYRKKYNCPVVLVGDLNTGYYTKAVEHLLSKGYRHAKHIATDYAEESVGYHACTNTGYEKCYSNVGIYAIVGGLLLAA